MTYVKKLGLIKLVDDSEVQKYKGNGFEVYQPEQSIPPPSKTPEEIEAERAAKTEAKAEAKAQKEAEKKAKLEAEEQAKREADDNG